MFAISTLALLAAVLLAACGGPQATEQPTPTREQAATEHQEEAEGEEHLDEHAPEEHMAGEHEVPEEAAAVGNPVEASQESIHTGAELFAANCAICHGEGGEGDGPAAAGLEAPPADLHAEHVQENSDGALFYIISHSRPESPMPAWEEVLTEEERWHLVNFLRTFVEE
jgi:mono/diheme cytochrome c family protein